jgi:anaerobic magnesium-protoporphyrin IX monomethyl ester cyclase
MTVSLKPSPPLGLAFIAGALKEAGHTVQIIDSFAQAPGQFVHFNDDIVINGLTEAQTAQLIAPGTEIIGFTMMFSGNWLFYRQLIDAVGDAFPKAKVIAGGEHITAVPELCIKQTRHLAACVLGEGEETVIALVNALRDGTPLEQVAGIAYRAADGSYARSKARARVKDVESVPLPAWELFPLDDYNRHGISYGVEHGSFSLPLMATRGCPFQCTFCSSPQMWGTRYYMRSPKHVADEIESYVQRFGIHNFDFYDLTAIIKREWIIEFAKDIVDRGLKITWQIPAGTRSEAIDQEVAHHLYLSGCRNITYAPESGSKEMLRLIKKKVSLSNMLESISYSSKEKMNIKINFILGFPDEHHKDLWLSMWFLVKASWYGVNDMAPGVFSPYPGSELFNRLVAEGDIDLENDDYFYSIIYVDTFDKTQFYNKHISERALKVYVIMYLLVFYGSNYLFRPWRLFRTVYNLISDRAESRAEMALSDLIKRSKVQILPADKAPVLLPAMAE